MSGQQHCSDPQDPRFSGTMRAECQIPGCSRTAASVVEIDLPDAWEASREYTTLTVHACLCHGHGHDVTRRVTALLEGRVEYFDLLAIVEAAVRYEKSLELRLQAASA